MELKVPFAPPRIDDKVIEAVADALRSGWITTGPRTKQFEKEIAEYCSAENVLCLNSATAGLETALRWFGVGPGDEVILPAYTYSSTANVIIHCGATPVFVDVLEDFNINPDEIRKHVTDKTKAILSVDFGGWPVDYDEIKDLLQSNDVRNLFSASNPKQAELGRVIHISDAAHALGAVYNGKKVGTQADMTVFSFHAVKNLTTAEGGAMVINLPSPFNNRSIYDELVIFTLHGQTKDALAKFKGSGWRYDIVDAGYKFNMPDVLAAIGLVELRRYESETLPRRLEIFEMYRKEFAEMEFAICPPFKTETKTSSAHVFALRLKNMKESERDEVMDRILEWGVSVNVHFIPIPMFSFYSGLGYDIKDYPLAFNNYQREISLPVFFDMTDKQVDLVVNSVKNAVNMAAQSQ